MSVLGIDQITYGADDLPACRQFFQDWGLSLVSEAADELVFECLNGCKVVVAAWDKPGLPPAMEEGPTLREVVWGVESDADLDRYAAAIAQDPAFTDTTVDGARRIGCTDPNGLAVRLQVSRKRAVEVDCGAMNTWNAKPRVNQPAPIYERATPIEVGHVVFFVSDVKGTSAFYAQRFGFVSSDGYPNRGAFMRCAPEGGHHDLFLLQIPSGKRGLNHVAFTVRVALCVRGQGDGQRRGGQQGERKTSLHEGHRVHFFSVRKAPFGPSAFFWRRVWPSRPPSTAHSANTVGPGSNSRGCQSAVSWSSSA